MDACRVTAELNNYLESLERCAEITSSDTGDFGQLKLKTNSDLKLSAARKLAASDIRDPILKVLSQEEISALRIRAGGGRQYINDLAIAMGRSNDY